MTKEVFIALIQKDIRELDMITQGLYETETLSPTIIKLASSKAKEVVDNLQKLAEIKIEKPVTPAIIEEEIVGEEQTSVIPEIVAEKEVEKEKPEQTSTSQEESTPQIEQKPTEKVIIKTDTKIEGINKPKDDSLASSLAQKKITDLKQVISIADRFRFQRELFTNNADKMNETLIYLNSSTGIENALAYLSSNFDWKADNENVEDFMNLVKRLFV